MFLTITESPVLGGGAPLPSRPSRTGDFAFSLPVSLGGVAKCPRHSRRLTTDGRGRFPKTEQLAETVPGCSQGDAAPKGLGRPVNKPLMRKPRAPYCERQPDRVTAGDIFNEADAGDAKARVPSLEDQTSQQVAGRWHGRGQRDVGQGLAAGETARFPHWSGTKIGQQQLVRVPSPRPDLTTGEAFDFTPSCRKVAGCWFNRSVSSGLRQAKATTRETSAMPKLRRE